MKSTLGDMAFFPNELDRMAPFCQPIINLINEIGSEIFQCPKRFPTRTTLNEPNIKDGKFQAKFDVRDFDPEGIELKVDGDTFHIKVKKEKKTDDNNYEYYEYQRKFTIPKEVIQDQLKCTMNDQGILVIEAPIKEEAKSKEKQIPIQFLSKSN